MSLIMARRAGSPELARVWTAPVLSRKILSWRISWMTIAILSVVRRSTSGRAPVVSATIRLWMSLGSLKRPPTLFTIFSSFKSSSIACPFEKWLQDGSQGRQGRFQIVVDHLMVIFICAGQLALGPVETLLQRSFVFGFSFTQALLVGL